MPYEIGSAVGWQDLSTVQSAGNAVSPQQHSATHDKLQLPSKGHQRRAACNAISPHRHARISNFPTNSKRIFGLRSITTRQGRNSSVRNGILSMMCHEDAIVVPNRDVIGPVEYNPPTPSLTYEIFATHICRVHVFFVIATPPSPPKGRLNQHDLPTSSLPETTPPTAQSDVRQYSRTFLLWAMFSAEKNCLQLRTVVRAVPRTQGAEGGAGAGRGTG